MRSYRMKRIYDFQCTTCHSHFDKYTEYCTSTSCPTCGNLADKIISAPRIQLEGITGAFPGAAAKWERMHKTMGGKKRD